MNSKIIVLIPATTMSTILNQKTGFTKYALARLMNRSEPARKERSSGSLIATSA